MQSNNFKVAVFGLGIILVYPALSLLFGGGGAVKIPALTGILCILMLLDDNCFIRSLFSKSAVYWAILMFYHFCNALLKNVSGTDGDIFLTNILNTTIALVLTIYIYRLNSKKALYSIILIYYMYLIIGAFVIYKSGYSVDSKLGMEGINPNIIGQFSGFLGIIIANYTIQYSKPLLHYFLLIAFPTVITLLTQSRNALMLIAFSLIICFVGYVLKSKIKISTIIFSTFLLILVLLLSNYALNNTIAGERILAYMDGETEVNYTYATNTVWDKVLGERMVYYVVGFDNFIHNSWTGIGLWNFSNYNKYPYPLHSEIMVHLTEGGLIGIGLYLLFVCNIIFLFIKKRNKQNFIHWQYIVTFISILVVGISARVFAYVQFFPVFGIIIGYLTQKKGIKYFMRKSMFQQIMAGH